MSTVGVLPYTNLSDHGPVTRRGLTYVDCGWEKNTKINGEQDSFRVNVYLTRIN